MNEAQGGGMNRKLADIPDDWCPESLAIPLKYWQRFIPTFSGHEWVELDDGATSFVLDGWEASPQPDCTHVWMDNINCEALLGTVIAIARYEYYMGRTHELTEATAPLACYFYKGRMCILWQTDPGETLRRIPEYVMDGLYYQGGEAVVHVEAWTAPPKVSRGQNTPGQLYTIDQLRKAWGAGAWAARRGRA